MRAPPCCAQADKEGEDAAAVEQARQPSQVSRRDGLFAAVQQRRTQTLMAAAIPEAGEAGEGAAAVSAAPAAAAVSAAPAAAAVSAAPAAAALAAGAPASAARFACAQRDSLATLVQEEQAPTSPTSPDYSPKTLAAMEAAEAAKAAAAAAAGAADTAAAVGAADTAAAAGAADSAAAPSPASAGAEDWSSDEEALGEAEKSQSEGQEDLSMLNVTELKERCRRFGLNQQGRKAQLVERLQARREEVVVGGGDGGGDRSGEVGEAETGVHHTKYTFAMFKVYFVSMKVYSFF